MRLLLPIAHAKKISKVSARVYSLCKVTVTAYVEDFFLENFCHELQTRPSSRELLCLVSFLDLERTNTPVHARSLHAKSVAPTRIQRTRPRSFRPCWSRLLRTATLLPAKRLHANAACFLSVALRLTWRAARQRDSSWKQCHVLNARYRLPILHFSKTFLRSAQV
jgi:hypothetical protein